MLDKQCLICYTHEIKIYYYIIIITYDPVVIPASEYLVRNTRQSRHNHSLSYRHIHTNKDYTGSHFSPELSSTGMPSLPMNQLSLPCLSLAMLSAR